LRPRGWGAVGKGNTQVTEILMGGWKKKKKKREDLRRGKGKIVPLP